MIVCFFFPARWNRDDALEDGGRDLFQRRGSCGDRIIAVAAVRSPGAGIRSWFPRPCLKAVNRQEEAVMSRTSAMARLRRALSLALHCNRTGVPARQAIEQLNEHAGVDLR